VIFLHLKSKRGNSLITIPFVKTDLFCMPLAMFYLEICQSSVIVDLSIFGLIILLTLLNCDFNYNLRFFKG